MEIQAGLKDLWTTRSGHAISSDASDYQKESRYGWPLRPGKYELSVITSLEKRTTVQNTNYKHKFPSGKPYAWYLPLKLSYKTSLHCRKKRNNYCLDSVLLSLSSFSRLVLTQFLRNMDLLWKMGQSTSFSPWGKRAVENTAAENEKKNTLRKWQIKFPENLPKLTQIPESHLTSRILANN